MSLYANETTPQHKSNKKYAVHLHNINLNKRAQETYIFKCTTGENYLLTGFLPTRKF